MIIKPSIEEIKNIKKDYKCIPVSTEIFSDITTPIQVLRILKEKDNHCFLLESVEKAEQAGRYSFLGFEPSMEITCQNGELKIKSKKKEEEIITNTPQDYIKKLLEEYKSPVFDDLPPFTGGLAGYFAFDFICRAGDGAGGIQTNPGFQKGMKS